MRTQIKREQLQRPENLLQRSCKYLEEIKQRSSQIQVPTYKGIQWSKAYDLLMCFPEIKQVILDLQDHYGQQGKEIQTSLTLNFLKDNPKLKIQYVEQVQKICNEFMTFFTKKSYIPELSCLLIVDHYLGLFRLQKIDKEKLQDFCDISILSSIPYEGFKEIIQNSSKLSKMSITLSQYKDKYLTQVIRVRLNEDNSIDEFLTAICDIWVNTTDWHWEFTTQAKSVIEHKSQDAEYKWKNSDLMSLCPITQNWALKSHSWALRKGINPYTCPVFYHKKMRRDRRDADPLKKAKLRNSGQYWIPPSSRQMKIHESFKLGTEKLSTESKPFKPKGSPGPKEDRSEECKASLIPFLSQVKIEDLKDDLSKDRTPQKEESKSTTSESQRAESIFMTPKTSTKTDSECKSSASSSAQIKKYSLPEILSVFKIMGNFSGISDTYENGQKSVMEKSNPGTLKLTRKIQDVLSISKPCYILENENAELTRLSTRTPLGQRTNLKTNPCNDLSLKFLHDLETELKHTPNFPLKIPNF